MAASVETQRLISVSLGKIAQSRGQRGGINLHKNLLVATVLHKARTAYMMETYSYHQQQQTLQRQKLQQQEQLLQQQQEQQRQQQQEQQKSCVVESESVSHEQDVEMGQAAITNTPPAGEESRSSSPSAPAPSSDICPVTPSAQQECREGSNVVDKENHPPTSETSIHEGCVVDDAKKSESPIDVAADHLAAATQLSHDAALASTENSTSHKLTSGTPTCAGILKRRRENPPAASSIHEGECPASKKVRVNNDVPSSFSVRIPSPCQFSSSIHSDCSSDESDSESDNEVSMVHASDSPQITNLVTIFNSGFSGLCANKMSEQDSNTFTPLTKLRPESPTPSLMCSSEVGRLGSLPSALVLSA